MVERNGRLQLSRERLRGEPRHIDRNDIRIAEHVIPHGERAAHRLDLHVDGGRGMPSELREIVRFELLRDHRERHAARRRRRHAENLRHLVPNAELVAIADVNSVRARQVATELEITNSFDSLESMLECKELNAVVIATPDKFHAPAVKTVAAAGKDMLIPYKAA